MSSNVAYRGVFLVMAIFAVGALLFGTYGLFTVLTGGTDAGEGPDIRGEFQCGSFDGDPEMPHDSQLESPRTVVGDSQIGAFNTSTTANGTTIEIETIGPLIDVSAATVDGTELPVQLVDGENRFVVADRDETPFRVFIESLDGDSPVRTELDICPPA